MHFRTRFTIPGDILLIRIGEARGREPIELVVVVGGFVSIEGDIIISGMCETYVLVTIELDPRNGRSTQFLWVGGHFWRTHALVLAAGIADAIDDLCNVVGTEPCELLIEPPEKVRRSVTHDHDVVGSHFRVGLTFRKRLRERDEIVLHLAVVIHAANRKFDAMTGHDAPRGRLLTAVCGMQAHRCVPWDGLKPDCACASGRCCRWCRADGRFRDHTRLGRRFGQRCNRWQICLWNNARTMVDRRGYVAMIHGILQAIEAGANSGKDQDKFRQWFQSHQSYLLTVG